MVNDDISHGLDTGGGEVAAQVAQLLRAAVLRVQVRPQGLSLSLSHVMSHQHACSGPNTGSMPLPPPQYAHLSTTFQDIWHLALALSG